MSALGNAEPAVDVSGRQMKGTPQRHKALAGAPRGKSCLALG